MSKKFFYKRIVIITLITIFFMSNVSYNVKAMPIYTNDGSWVTICKDPFDSTKYKSDYDANEYLDFITLVDYLISKGKYKIYIKDGEYDLNGCLHITNDNVVILGESKDNTKLVETDINSTSILVNASNVDISTLKIDSSGGQAGIQVQYANNVVIENSNIIRSKSFPGVVYYGINDNNSIIGNNIYCLSTPIEKMSIDFLNQKNGTIDGNNIDGGMINFRLCKDVTVSNNKVTNSIGAGIRGTLGKLGNTSEFSADNKVINNTIQTPEDSGIAIVKDDPGDNLSRYDGILIDNNTVTDSRYFGIEINDLNNGVITNNKISKIDFYGIYLLNSDNLQVDNNIISNCSKYTGSSPKWPSSFRSSIYFEVNVKNSEVKDNTVYNDPAEYPVSFNPDGIRVQKMNDNDNNNIFKNNINGKFGTYIYANLGNPEYTNIMQTTVITENSIQLEWGKISETTEYEIQVEDENGNNIGSVFDAGSSNSYVCTGLNNNTTYKFILRVKGEQWSNPVTAKTSMEVIPVITKDSATENSIKVKWAGVNGATGYELQIDENPVLIDVGLAESYIHNGLASNSVHKYKVRKKGGQWSNEISIYTLAASPIITPPSVTTPPAVTPHSPPEVNPSPPVVTHPSGAGTTPAAVTTPSAGTVIPTNGGTGKPGSYGGGESSSDDDSDTENHNISFEFSLEDYKTLFFKENIASDKEEDKLKRMLLYTFGQQYHLYIRTIKDNQYTNNFELNINLTPGSLFSENEIREMSIDKNDKTDTILVKDFSNTVNKQENGSYSDYSIIDEYIFSIEDTGIKVQKIEKYKKDIKKLK